jgi:hypothetical protein
MTTKLKQIFTLSKSTEKLIPNIVIGIQYEVDYYPIQKVAVLQKESIKIYDYELGLFINDSQFTQSKFINKLIDDDMLLHDWLRLYYEQVAKEENASLRIADINKTLA